MYIRIESLPPVPALYLHPSRRVSEISSQNPLFMMSDPASIDMCISFRILAGRPHSGRLLQRASSAVTCFSQQEAETEMTTKCDLGPGYPGWRCLVKGQGFVKGSGPGNRTKNE